MLVWLLIMFSGLPAQNVQNISPGRQAFEARCATCHGADGNGGDLGPAIVSRLTEHDDQQLASLIRTGRPARGMPPSRIASSEMAHLLTFLRNLQRRAAGA